MSFRSFKRIAVASVASALIVTLAAARGGSPQQAAAPVRADDAKAAPGDRDADRPTPATAKPGHRSFASSFLASAEVKRLIDAYDLKPRRPFVAPGDPPPHEGAMIDVPYVIEPPDLIVVEVLEALPGRPISGERLVRPDGKVSLGFYGEVHVRGLTLAQAKVAIVRHLRRYIDDEVLGLVSPDPEPVIPRLPDRPGVPAEDPYDPLKPFNDLNSREPAKPARHGEALPSSPRSPGASRRPDADPGRASIRRTSLRTQEPKQDPKPNPKEKPVGENKEPRDEPREIVVPFPGSGQIKITIDIRGQGRPNFVAAVPDGIPPPAVVAGEPDEMTWRAIPPQDTDRVFIDVTKYESQRIYVAGFVHSPGRFPCTGNETVLDIIDQAGGLLGTADLDDIALVRPARGGKSVVYRVKLGDIRVRGDTTTNFQLFPGDRLLVGSLFGWRNAGLDRDAVPPRDRAAATSSRPRRLSTRTPRNLTHRATTR